ncbi:MAG: hypothetical protein HC904_13600 [Blastochloris sp.]|nr:hypothetical protein [Blastochloris sp.]
MSKETDELSVTTMNQGKALCQAGSETGRTMKKVFWVFLILVLGLTLPSMAAEDYHDVVKALDVKVSELGDRIKDMDEKIEDVKSKAAYKDIFTIAFVGGAFCALWAQKNKKNSWLWFFFGFFLPIVAVIVLLYKNSKILKEEETNG